MNRLKIDTSIAHKVTVNLVTEAKTFTKESEQKFGSQALLASIEEVLKEADLKLKDLDKD